MLYDNLSSVSQNVLKFYQQLTGEERRVPFIFGRNNLIFKIYDYLYYIQLNKITTLVAYITILAYKTTPVRHK
jgi:hypothetical protein